MTSVAVEWVDVFVRKAYQKVSIDILQHGWEQKACTCSMSTYVYLLASAAEASPSDTILDFKKFTAKKIV